MVSTLAILHVVVCVFLILLIMIQDPKGGGSGLFGGGGSNSIIGAGGAADMLTKMTRYAAIIFGALCIGLTIVTKPSKTGVFSEVPTSAVEPARIEKAEPGTQPGVTPEPAPSAPAAEAPAKTEDKK